MSIKVLIVDDSKFICNRIKNILEEEQDIHVVGVAFNGQQAIQYATELKPDVITMDIEMPVMDGISAVKRIMAECPTAILMLSASTHSGARATLDALSAGAIDFLPKTLDKIDGNREIAKQLLRRRVRLVALQAKKIRDDFINTSTVAKQTILSSPRLNSHWSVKKVELLVLVASTGGPVAIQTVLTQLSKLCRFPILIVQHMPQNFTKSFAERLNQLCQVAVREAEDGDVLIPGQAFLAPGGMQMVLQKGKNKKLKIREKLADEIYSPCADITLSSIAQEFSGHVLTVVLTGMGADGKNGAKNLKQKGFSLWAQDEESSIIYGMPKAIVDAKLADQVLSLDEIANQFSKLR